MQSSVFDKWIEWSSKTLLCFCVVQMWVLKQRRSLSPWGSLPCGPCRRHFWTPGPPHRVPRNPPGQLLVNLNLVLLLWSPKMSATRSAGQGTSRAQTSPLLENSHLYNTETQKCFAWSFYSFVEDRALHFGNINQMNIKFRANFQKLIYSERGFCVTQSLSQLIFSSQGLNSHKVGHNFIT
jgi:hypothetical protein